ncbi:MAG: hypothetical protein LBG20_01830 [Holosporaceae bacterium]|jgi:RNA polymerase sigma-54 factor|nr:hypothetical protein [Holosporaceae bacterium]
MKEKLDNHLIIAQHQTLSQSQRYSLAVLMMNNIELQEHIKELFVKNPFLIVKRVSENDSDDMTERIPSKNSMWDEISKEIAFLHFTDSEKRVTEALINNMEDNYLDNGVLQHVFRSEKVSYLDLLKIIHRLKKTSFATRFAFNLQDKIKTFLENEGYTNSRNFMGNLDMILHGNRGSLMSHNNLSNGELHTIVKWVRNALTAPSDYEDVVTQYKNVDLVVEEESIGEFKVLMDQTTSPEVEFDSVLYIKSIAACRAESDRSYIKNNASEARLLVKSMGSRSSTLLKIASEIVRRQWDFFSGRNSYLTPISTHSIANSLLLHESTISRAVLNKYIATPRGIFGIRFLLPREIKSCSSRVSDYSIREYMKKLIGNEPKNNPYSDGNIASFLETLGINISRRTVSKYRDILHIPNLTDRTRMYKMCNYSTKCL